MKKFSKSIKFLKEIRWWKKLLVLQAIIFVPVVGIMLSREVCTSAYSEISGGCQEYISLLKKVQVSYENPYIGHTYLLLTLLGILYIFFRLPYAFGKWTEKKFDSWNIYKKIFTVEFFLLAFLLFLLVMLFTFVYEGSSCLLDNCNNKVALLELMSFWIPDTIVETVSSWIFWAVLAVPHGAAFLIQRSKKLSKK